MSNDENSTENENVTEKESAGEKKASAMAAVGKTISSLLELKEKSPKVFYGVVGGVVVLILFLMMSGGSDKPPITSFSPVSLTVGQQYVLRAPNAADPSAKVRLVGAPGSLEAYDDTEKADREGCKHLPQGTPVTLKALASAFGQTNSFGQVTVDSGECKGQTNWTLSVNIQQK